MCLIIDLNVVNLIFPQPTTDFEPVFKAISQKRARIVYGGKLKREYQRAAQFWRVLVRLDQQGSARPIDDAQVDALAKKLLQGGTCCSDDEHVLALAVVSGSRLLCSNDGNLCADFRNATLISNPRGNVYRRPAHASLIRRHCS